NDQPWRGEAAEGGEGRVRCGHVEEADLGGAECEGGDAGKPAAEAQPTGEVDDVVEADVLGEPHGRDVAGDDQRVAEGDRVRVPVVHVAWCPDLAVDGAAERTVVQPVERRVAVGEGGRVDDRLEGAGGL